MALHKVKILVPTANLNILYKPAFWHCEKNQSMQQFMGKEEFCDAKGKINIKLENDSFLTVWLMLSVNKLPKTNDSEIDAVVLLLF